ncbi:MAG TPA: hypothetical protein VN541_17835, partial [Tepidisphaeraceae bacterium]|nr:hypothetical protein [Tepidisphaeraceae bacterium]
MSSFLRGQLAGAYYGEGDIPLEWREKLARRNLIESFADSPSALGQSGRAPFLRPEELHNEVEIAARAGGAGVAVDG